jgi:NTP pyrophosphatase (non-canonical NTP hydrolase)
MMELNDLAQRIHKWSVEKGWWPKPTANLKRLVASAQADMQNGYSIEAMHERFLGINFEIETIEKEMRRLKFFEKVALMHTELSETLEEVRNGRDYREIYKQTIPSTDGMPPHSTNKPEGVPIELADVIIRILDTAAEYNIDLESAINAKLIYNNSRPFRHGGKLA